MHLVEQQPSYHTKPNHIVPISSISSLPVPCYHLLQWPTTFETLLETGREPGVTLNERSAIDSLQIIKLMASVLFLVDNRSEVVFDILLPQFLEIVNRGRKVIYDEELAFTEWRKGPEEKFVPNSQSRFTSGMGLVAPLFIVATKCRNRKLRREAIRLLLSRPRREGLWDSIFCAKVAELIMEIEEKDLNAYDLRDHNDWEYIPEEKRVIIREISFDLQARNGKLSYGMIDLCEKIVERDLCW